jgi:hypothetical protein
MDNTNRWSDMATALVDTGSKVVRKTAFDIQTTYVADAPRDTGFMVNSAYVVADGGATNTYGEGGFFGKGDSYLLDQSDLSEDVYDDQEKTTAIVAVGANYAEIVEKGSRYMEAQPAFYPAVESAGEDFNQAISLINDAWEKLSL